MKSFFLDTGFLIALESIDDQYHKAAQEVMKNKSIREVLSFDHHFEQAGFVMLPDIE